jgi:hypothetical protein
MVELEHARRDTVARLEAERKAMEDSSPGGRPSLTGAAPADRADDEQARQSPHRQDRPRGGYRAAARQPRESGLRENVDA